MKIISGYRDDETLRESFCRLSEKTFGLDFENWYKWGFWSDKYNPYSVIVEGQVASNVSVNRMDFTIDEQTRRYIQFGTVMTDDQHRGRGYAAMLLEKAIEDNPECAGYYLYANDQAVGFYEKMGFVKVPEYTYHLEDLQESSIKLERLPMENAMDWKRMLEIRSRLKPMGRAVMDNEGLLMFYLTYFMSECVYYSEELGILVIASFEDGILTLFDVYSKNDLTPAKAAALLPFDIQKVEFGFIPNDVAGLVRKLKVQENTTFMVKGERILEDMIKLGMLPELSHA